MTVRSHIACLSGCQGCHGLPIAGTRPPPNSRTDGGQTRSRVGELLSPPPGKTKTSAMDSADEESRPKISPCRHAAASTVSMVGILANRSVKRLHLHLSDAVETKCCFTQRPRKSQNNEGSEPANRCHPVNGRLESKTHLEDALRPSQPLRVELNNMSGLSAGEPCAF